MRHLWSALGLAVALIPLSARAASCQPDDLAKRAAALPAFLVVPDNATPRQVLAGALGCDPPPAPSLRDGQSVDPGKLIGHDVFSAEGHYLGTVTGTIVDRDTGATSSVVTGTTDSENFAIALDKLSPDKGMLFTDRTNPAPAMPPSESNGRYTRPNAFWPVGCGWSEYCDMTYIDIRSTPSGATMFFAGERVGTTEIRALVKSAKLGSLRIELTGYKPCRFADGNYRPPTETGQRYADFTCTLTPLH